MIVSCAGGRGAAGGEQINLYEDIPPFAYTRTHESVEK